MENISGIEQCYYYISYLCIAGIKCYDCVVYVVLLGFSCFREVDIFLKKHGGHCTFHHLFLRLSCKDFSNYGFGGHVLSCLI